jgi:hypothetical protein
MALLKDKKKVILSMPEPDEWTFMSYVTDGGRVITEDWDTQQTFEAEIALDTFIKSNRKTKSYTNWPEWRHKMHGKPGKAGVSEFGFKSGGKEYRILCTFKGKMCIVILCMAFHKQKVWDPSDTEKTVTDRAKEVKNGTATLKVLEKEREEK